ncbi:MAG: hypothetical protein M3116_01635, partial [Actinomycetota bacterium]|nr:hypothetical protein [Actinomycetota bacterium]
MTPQPGTPSDGMARALRAIWPNLPVLAVASLLCCLALVPSLLVSPGPTPIGALLAAVLLGPVWMAVISVTDAIVAGEDRSIRDLLAALPRQAGAGLRTAVVPGTLAASTLLAWGMYSDRPSAAWLVASIAISGAGLLFATLALPFAFSWRLLTGSSGRRLWLAACVQALARPVLALGTLAFAVLAVVAGTSWAVSLLMLMPGPLALLCSV